MIDSILNLYQKCDLPVFSQIWIMWVFSLFILSVVFYINRFVHVELPSLSWDKSHFVLVYNHLNVLLYVI